MTELDILRENLRLTSEVDVWMNNPETARECLSYIAGINTMARAVVERIKLDGRVR